jgi:predicted DCC family thiol-disulfide oxidoreductase YuxK
MNEDNRPVLFFDGYCNLCNGSVNFVLRYERNSDLLLAPLTSNYAKSVLSDFKPEDLPDSLVFYHNGDMLFLSDAAIELCRYLKFPFNLGSVLKVIPKAIRDYGYKFIAKRRYKWLGKRETCRIPTEEERLRFLS